MTRTMKIDYWQLQSDKAASSFSDVLRKFKKTSSKDPRRIRLYRNKAIRLHHLRKNTLWEGDFVAIKINDPARRGDVLGTLQDIDFEQDEGLVEETAFLYSEVLNTVVIQSTRTGVSSAAFAHFFRESTDFQATIDLLPIPSLDTMRRYKDLDKATSVEVAIARGFGGHVATNELGVSEMIDLAEELNGSQVTLKISVGRSWRSHELNLQKLKEMVRNTLGLSSNVSLKRLTVSGRTPDDERDVIDLVTERIRDEVSLEEFGRKSLAFDERVRILRRHFRDHKGEIEKLFNS